MKKSKITLISFFFFISILLTACQKQICSYCGRECFCTEYDVLGTTRYICDECLSNPRAAISGNVINDYESDLIDPAVYQANAIENYNDHFDSSEDDSSAPDISPIASVPLVTSVPAENQSELRNDSSVLSADSELSSLISNISSQLATHSMSLVKSEESDLLYSLYLNDNYINIDFEFSQSSSGKPQLSISKYSEASDNDFTAACIDSSIAFIGSGDYSGDGYTIFNNSVSLGNYSYNGCRFYYTESSDIEIAEGTAPIKYDISYQ